MKKTWTYGQKEEFLFKSTYCRFKIWFGMKNKNNKTFYGIETNCTPLQIATGRVKEVLFDKQKGYENCLLLEERFRDQYETAIIYQKKGNDWVELRKYRLGQLAEYSEADFTYPVTVAEVVIDANRNWTLKRVAKKVIRAPVDDTPPPAAPAGSRIAGEPTRAGDIAKKYGLQH